MPLTSYMYLFVIYFVQFLILVEGEFYFLFTVNSFSQIYNLTLFPKWLYFRVLGYRQHYVTCGSVIKLKNADYNVRLHSHDVKYGTGSGQQSVTATEIQEDINSHWQIKGGTGKVCPRGQPVKCGSTIRLEHVETKKNLHSHNFQSPLSGNQEISCYGEKGEGDSGDNWMVVCSGNPISPYKWVYINRISLYKCICRGKLGQGRKRYAEACRHGYVSVDKWQDIWTADKWTDGGRGGAFVAWFCTLANDRRSVPARARFGCQAHAYCSYRIVNLV